MEQSKIDAMMDGRTLTKENILNMYQMVRSASDAEEKKNVMKHSVFCGTASAEGESCGRCGEDGTACEYHSAA